MHSLYGILGVSPNASRDEIRNAYRAIALKTHPDRTQGDPALGEVFRSATEAFRILSDPEQRRKYDIGFRPTRSLRDLFFNHQDGRDVVLQNLPGARLTPKPGTDLLQVLPMESDLLRHGGSMTIQLPIPQQGLETELRTTELVIDVPADAIETPWCTLSFLGNPGTNGARSGNLVILFLPTDNEQKEHKE